MLSRIGGLIRRTSGWRSRSAGRRTRCPPGVITDTRERFWSRYVIERNELRAAGRAIDVTRVRDLTIRGNTLRFTRGGCGQREGVRVVNSHGGVVSGNTLRSLPAAFPVVRVDSSSTGIAVVGNVRK